MRKKLTLLLFFIFKITANLVAQDDFILHNMNLLPQSSLVNPAIMPNDQIYVGFPLLSNVNFSTYNTAFSYNQLISTKNNNVKINELISKIQKNNYLGVKFNLDLLNLGLRTKKMYILFSSTEKIEAQLLYPGDFFKFVWRGNGDEELIGKKQNFNFGLEAIHYRTYGFLVSRIINPKLTIGLKANYLYGMENIHTAKNDITFLTDSNDYSITASSNIEVNTSGISNIDIASKPYSNYQIKKKNSGLGLDIGGRYKLTDKVLLSASIVNLGYINWKDDTKTYESKNPNSTYKFDGVNLNQIFNGSNPNLDSTFKQLQDSALDKFSIIEKNKNYRTKLSPRIFIGGNFEPIKGLHTNLVMQGYFIQGKLNYATCIGANATFFNWLDIGVNYNISKNNYKNIGLGIGLWPGGTNLYIMTDNIIGAINYKSVKSLNARIGYSLMFGKYFLNDDADGDLIPDAKDKCPHQKGSKELGGCPDLDGDLVIDSEDDCPSQFGTKAMNGCPDRDGDRIIDRYDECPDIAGETQFKGCPDRDHDGIKDSDDACPTEAGTTELKGCPDKDSDGVSDAEDACPEKAGSRNNKGCPIDSDGDGVYDEDDKCPDVIGSPSTMGCPDIDTDGDGVKDKDDACVFTIGDKENNGCPIISENDKLLIENAQANLLFKSNTSEIVPTSFETLEALAFWMSNNKSELLLKGHTSNELSESISLALSKERVEAVKSYLIAKNVNPTRIKVEFFGYSKPIADNNTPEGRAKNNRIEFIIGYK